MGIIMRNNIAYGGGSSNETVELTLAEYERREAAGAIDSDTIYFINDATDSYNAGKIMYDNTESGIEASTVQGAIDELNSNLSNSKIVSLTFDDPITITTEDYATTSAGIIMIAIQNGSGLGYLTVNSLKLGDIRVFESSTGAGTTVQWQYIIPKGDTIKIGGMNNIYNNNYKVLFYPFK